MQLANYGFGHTAGRPSLGVLLRGIARGQAKQRAHNRAASPARGVIIGEFMRAKTVWVIIGDADADAAR